MILRPKDAHENRRKQEIVLNINGVVGRIWKDQERRLLSCAWGSKAVTEVRESSVLVGRDLVQSEWKQDLLETK